MLIRLVKLSIKTENEVKFQTMFAAKEAKIAGFDGCQSVVLLKDISKNANESVFFTKSVWQSEQHLNNYRQSDFFKATWTETKKLFLNRAEAWSVQEVKQ